MITVQGVFFGDMNLIYLKKKMEEDHATILLCPDIPRYHGESRDDFKPSSETTSTMGYYGIYYGDIMGYIYPTIWDMPYDGMVGEHIMGISSGIS